MTHESLEQRVAGLESALRRTRLGMAAPAGIGAPMRDRLGLVVGNQGQASLMLIDNETRGVAKLYSDGKGDGGVQVFKWDMDKKEVHIKTFTFDGEKTAVQKLGV